MYFSVNVTTIVALTLKICLFNTSSIQEVTYSTSSCQTAGELYKFKDAEVQSGIQTAVTLTQVTDSSSGLTLLEYLTKKNSGIKGSDASKWKDRIEQGFVSVDCEATVDPGLKLHSHNKSSRSTYLQIIKFTFSKPYSSPLVSSLSNTLRT